MMAETFMLQALQNGLLNVRQNPAILDEVLTALNPNELAAAKVWFSNPKTKLYIAPGFPQAPEQLPFIGVTMAEEGQIESQTGIGLDYYSDNEGKNYRGARFKGTLKATIYTPNADLIVWISTVLKWSLLSQYDWFDETAGFNNIQTKLGDYEPSPGFLPIFTFARGIFLSAEYDLVFTSIPETITSGTVAGDFNIY
jgi:hypothetical protein